MSEANIWTEEWDLRGEKMQISGARVGKRAGAQELGASVYVLDPGASGFHVHAHFRNEELFVVLEGAPTLRTPGGDRVLERGEVVACPRGRAGTHTISNPTGEPARVLAISTTYIPEVVEYPELDRVFVVTREWEQGDDEGFVLSFERSSALQS